jgi:hypothetical protein
VRALPRLATLAPAKPSPPPPPHRGAPSREEDDENEDDHHQDCNQPLRHRLGRVVVVVVIVLAAVETQAGLCPRGSSVLHQLSVAVRSRYVTAIVTAIAAYKGDGRWPVLAILPPVTRVLAALGD